MTWGFVAGAAITVAGDIIQGKSAGKAADAQRDAAQSATAAQLQMYNQNREDQAPWRQAGGTAVGQLSKGTVAGGEFNRNFTMADFNRDPGYQFRMDQGSQALQRSAAARGGLMNGGTLKALDRYGQDYASGEYSNAYNRFNNNQSLRFNRLADIAGLGQTSVGQTGAMGTQVGGQIGSNLIGAGNAQAAGIIGQGNAYGGALNSLGNFYMQRQYMQPQQQSQVQPVSSGGGYYPANSGEGWV